ncbi:Asp23/Gls24 family envelope stress response protein [Anaeromicrobium sediminis]|uniref:Asp23/Gls24 family envelope stress response protein n=1 Tax=Anaeromicrobium sediminis TaxID=1478221 RepID=A0A267MH64_9FIRM|nr:Asp23/Gls24 family envelope stress response protein [Anaeromicrobium sediminis]PAB58876.1 Asp23/Gls24 family envelope stress response protein [Anaeromicrobium sediminis]
MGAKLKNDLGNIHIDENVISEIIGMSAMECYGLVGMASKSAASGLTELLRRGNMSKGVRIESDGDKLSIDLYIVIQFGTRIGTVAQNVMDKVKYNVETTTGLKVEKVNINVKDVRVQK